MEKKKNKQLFEVYKEFSESTFQMIKTYESLFDIGKYSSELDGQPTTLAETIDDRKNAIDIMVKYIKQLNKLMTIHYNLHSFIKEALNKAKLKKAEIKAETKKSVENIVKVLDIITRIVQWTTDRYLWSAGTNTETLVEEDITTLLEEIITIRALVEEVKEKLGVKNK